MSDTPTPITSSSRFNDNWRFALEDDPNFSAGSYPDTTWRRIRLPHDWSVEHPFNQDHGDGATGYLPGGIGWYRKHFATPHLDDRLIFILFDGIYNHSEVWCNDQPLGRNPYGYSPFWFDLTPHLRTDSSEQAIAVRVDHSRYVDSRWYTGSGIYRDVTLLTKSRLHIPIWGTRLTTPTITDEAATVALEVQIKNAFDSARSGILRTVIVDPAGVEVAALETPFTLAAQQTSLCQQTLSVPSPALWSPDHPHLYRAITSLMCAETLHEVYTTPFGIRHFRFDPNAGFFLNGERTLIKGVCLHHDGGLVGAAVPDAIWRRRLLALKAGGCNAIRTAHNPASEAFLNLCDELGFLVQAEFFDEWNLPKDKRLNNIEQHDDYVSRGYAEVFEDWAESDLKRTMQRDRNHPSIFQWSIGNEIEWAYASYARATGYFDPAYEGNYFWETPPYSWDEIKARFDALPADQHSLAETAQRLARWTRDMDTTRPVTANCILPSVSHMTGYTDTLDVVGYSYRQVIYDLGHAAFPEKPLMGTENVGQWHEWQHVIERPFISGLFLWTGIHYLGEACGKWPEKGTPSGLLDFAGFPRPPYYLFQSLWTDDPMVQMTTQTLAQTPYQVDETGSLAEKIPGGWRHRVWYWHDSHTHWNYAPAEPTVVEIYTNCAEVELLLNGNSLGCQALQDQPDRVIKWLVPFKPGVLEARATTASGQTVTTTLTTAQAPAAIQLTCDTTTLAADGRDTAHVIAQLVDAHGMPVRHVEQEIVFSTEGPCRILGVDNGAVQNVQPYQSDRLITSQGRALLLLQATYETGVISVQASSATLTSNRINLLQS